MNKGASSAPPQVSVVLIFYNEARFVHEAIASVIAQTFTDWELLLVDDGSTDASSAIARHAEGQSDRVRYLHHDGHANRGPSASRNLGIRHARGALLAFLDGDDVWLPNKLEEQVALMNAQPGVGMLYGQPEHWYSWTGDPADVGRDHVPELGSETGVLLDGQGLLADMVARRVQTPCPSSTLVRRAVVMAVGGFEDDFRNVYEDQVFTAKVCLSAKVLVAPNSWDRYRQHSDSAYAVARSTGESRQARSAYLEWLQRYLVRQQVRNARLSAVVRSEVRKMHPGLLRTSARQLRGVAALIRRGSFGTIVHKVLGGNPR